MGFLKFSWKPHGSNYSHYIKCCFLKKKKKVCSEAMPILANSMSEDSYSWEIVKKVNKYIFMNSLE